MKSKVGAISFLIILFAFQNCGDFKVSTEISASSQCVKKLIEKTISEGGWAISDCNNHHNYYCYLGLFGPDQKNHKYRDSECSFESGEEICIDLDIESFDTSTYLNSDHVSPNAFEEGGEFNRSEYQCSHRFILANGLPMIYGQGLNLSDALTDATQQCLRGAK